MSTSDIPLHLSLTEPPALITLRLNTKVVTVMCYFTPMGVVTECYFPSVGVVTVDVLFLHL